MSKESEKQKGKGHPDPDNDGRDHYKRHVEGSITVHGQLETHLPPDLAQKQETRDKNNDGRDEKRFRVEILTLIFVILGAGLTAVYVSITHHIAKTGDDALYRQNRPWLGVVGTVYPYVPMSLFPANQVPSGREGVSYTLDFAHPPGDKFVSYDGFFNLHNYGASPALHSAYSVMMARTIDEIERASNGACEVTQNAAASGGTVNKEVRGGITLFPGAEQPEPFIAGARAFSIPNRVWLMGCIRYQDTSGRWHTTKFCEYGMAGTQRSLISCDFYTYAD